MPEKKYVGIQVDAWGAIIEGLQERVGDTDYTFPEDIPAIGLDLISNFTLSQAEKKMLVDSGIDSYQKLIETNYMHIHRAVQKQSALNDTPKQELIDEAKEQAKCILAKDWDGLKKLTSKYVSTPGVAKLYRELREKFKKRNISRYRVDLAIVQYVDPFGYWFNLTSKLHQVYAKDLDNGGLAYVAVNIDNLGDKDISISWRLFERNWIIEMMQMLPVYFFMGLGGLVFLGDLLLARSFNPYQWLNGDLGGIILTFFVNPITLAVFAFVLWLLLQAFKAYQKVMEQRYKFSTATLFQQFESRLLATAINDSFLELMDDYKILPENIRVIRSKQEEKLADIKVAPPDFDTA